MFISVVAFCTMLNNSMIAEQCVYVEAAEEVYSTSIDCLIKGDMVGQDVRMESYARRALKNYYSYKGKLVYSVHCVTTEDIEKFWNSIEVE